MRIVERYSTGMRIFLARGGWAALTPLRRALETCHRLRRRGRGSGSTVPARPLEGGVRVVSVGNLESGGTGKTPCVLALAAELERRAHRPVVVTRGYGGAASRLQRPVIAALQGRIDRARAGEALIWDGRDLPREQSRADQRAAAFLGDEACLYLRQGLTMVIDRDRGRAVRAALKALSPSHILLDDAFHRTDVSKDLDILLLDYERPFGDGRLLPYGTLREPPAAAARASAVVFTRASGCTAPAAAQRFVEHKPLFFARHAGAGLFGRDDAEVDPLALAGRPLAVFSGIARPESFEALAVQAGLRPDLAIRFDDHRRYTPRDVEFMLAQAGAEAVLVTTAKDWFRVAALVPAGVALLRLEMRMRIEGIERLLEPVLG